MQSYQKTKIISSGILFLAAIAGWLFSQHFFKETKAEFQALKVYPNQKSFTGFQLVDQNNKQFSIEEFEGHWTLVFFGFTYCPDICPNTLNQLQRVNKKLQESGIEKPPRVMLISVDPERDTPEQLKNYINFFNPEFIAATGDKGSLLSLSTQLGVAYHVEEHEEGQLNYDVNHTAAMFLVSPEKMLFGIFQTPHEDEKLFNDLKLITEL